MNEKNTRTLSNTFKFFFRPTTPGAISLGFGFDCGDGWYKLLYSLCEGIQAVLIKSPEIRKEFCVVQVKEKFGDLRFYTQGGNKEINKLIDEAESKSAETCELCGEKGGLREGGWLVTLCDKCNKKRN